MLCPILCYLPGTEVGVDVADEQVLVLGTPWATAQAVEGNLAELEDFAARTMATAQRAQAKRQP